MNRNTILLTELYMKRLIPVKSTPWCWKEQRGTGEKYLTEE